MARALRLLLGPSLGRVMEHGPHLPSSADTATEGVDFTIASLPISFLSCDQPPPLRLNTQAAPIPPLSLDPPTMMTVPSADSATNGADFPTALVPTSFLSSVH